jgi:hypothetical protein
MRKNISRGSDCDFARVAQYFTMDVITKIAYGEAFGCLQEGQDIHGYIEIIEKLVPFLAFCASYPPFWYLLNLSWVQKLVGPSLNDKTGIGKLMRCFSAYSLRRL